MSGLIGEADGPTGRKQQISGEALQNALVSAPPPPAGTDPQRFRVLSIEFQHRGFTGITKTTVKVEVAAGAVFVSRGADICRGNLIHTSTQALN